MRRVVKFAVWIALAAAGAGAAWFALGRPPAVTLAKLARGPAIEAVYATGAVEPAYWAKIATTQLGRIAEIPAKEGDKVKAGDVLMRLDDTEAKANLTKAEADLQWETAELERISKLADQSIASRQALQRQIAKQATAEAAVAAARQRLSEMTLRAPLDGEVIRLDGNVGEVVRQGDVVAWIGQCCPMRIEAEVDEEDIPRVQRGQAVLVKADAFPNRVFAAKVASITPKGDPIAKNYRVRIVLDPEQPLRVGMTVEINIVVRENRQALLAPFAAVRDGVVFAVERGRAVARPVKTGIVGARLVEIVEGAAEGDAVIADPPRDLAAGDRVRVVTPKPAAGAPRADADGKK
jgi:RND family efflux transporter MFP subunit